MAEHEIEVRRLTGTIYERHQYENLLAQAAEMKAVQDYNLMMGNLEDPAEDGEEDETEVE